MDNKRVEWFRFQKVPRKTGELARLRVLQGLDQGSVYIIYSNQITLGRGEESDLQLNDLKISRIHGSMTLVTSDGVASEWRIHDQGSANGILLNTVKISDSVLRTGDIIQLGESFLEFLSADVEDAVLMNGLKPISNAQSESKGIAALFRSYETQRLSPSGEAVSQSSQKRVPLYLFLFLVGIYLFLADEGSHKSKKLDQEKAVDSQPSLASYLPESTEATKRVNAFFKNGFREYLSGNLSRARLQFETALQIAPHNFLSRLYLENCKLSLNHEVDRRLREGKKAMDAGKFKEAKWHYERIVRLLAQDTNNENWAIAKKNLDAVNQAMKTPALLDY